MASDPIALALIHELCRGGSLDASGIERIAANLEAGGYGDDAHAVRCTWLASVAPPPAEARRERIRLVPKAGEDDA